MDLINVWIMEFAVTNACRMFVVARNIYRLVTVLREQKKTVKASEKRILQ